MKPPFVLTGHSYGGWLVLLYTATYQADLAGMVLVQAGTDNPRPVGPDGKLVPQRISKLSSRSPR